MVSKKKQIQEFEQNCLSSESSCNIFYTNSFLKSVKKHIKTQTNKKLLCDVIEQLSKDGDLVSKKYKAHNLIGDFIGYREAHIKHDLLIIWKKSDSTITLTLLGTHSELFD